MSDVPIDLNADVGEGLDAVDVALMPLVSSVNVACGGHAGDVRTMRRAVSAARQRGVAVGAHPSYPDREGFGRQPMSLTADELRSTIEHQIADLVAVAAEAGVRLSHVKPHGALYGLAARDADTAALVADIVAGLDRELTLVGLAGSKSVAAGRAAGLDVAAEAFADRVYEEDGSLRDRSLPGAVLAVPDAVAAQALMIARDGRVASGDGGTLEVHADTLCLHGDTPGAVENARHVRAALEGADIEVTSLRSSRG